MNTDIVRAFLSKVKGATASRSDDVRLSTADAQLLAIAIGELLVTRVEQTSETPRVMAVNMDGGRIDPRSQ